MPVVDAPKPSPVAPLGNVIKAQQKFIADVLTQKPTQVYRLDDYSAIRKNLYDNVKEAVTKRFPLYNDKYELSVENVDYDDPEDVDVDLQKKAIMEGKSITRRLRGEWVLRDSSGKTVSKSRRMTIMRVPHLTDRGSFIRNGSEYVFTNIMRLEPGVYTRQKPEEITAQFNIKQGTGPGFSMSLSPSSGLFQVRRGSQNAPAYTVLHDIGVTDDQLRASWGEELFNKNKTAGTTDKARQAADKIYNG